MLEMRFDENNKPPYRTLKILGFKFGRRALECLTEKVYSFTSGLSRESCELLWALFPLTDAGLLQGGADICIPCSVYPDLLWPRDLVFMRLNLTSHRWM